MGNDKITVNDIYVMSAICAFCVANNYYNQPILMLISNSIGVTYKQIGNLPTIVQLAYAAGLLFLVPLGDKFNRKKLLQSLLFINLFASAAAFIATNFIFLEIATFFIGISSIGAQIIIPAVSQYVDKKNVGNAVGILLSGLVTGILFGRLFSGYIGGILGWRSVFLFAACIDVIIILFIHFKFPNNADNNEIGYKKLMKSVMSLVLTEKELRRSCFSGFVIFGAYSALWGIITYLTSLPPFYFTSHDVGLIGLCGIAGVIASPYVGHLTDKSSPIFVVAVGAVISFAGFTVMYYSAYSLIILLISIILLEISTRFSMIGNQLRAFSLNETAKSRLNTAFMTSYFLGGSVGTKLGSIIGGTYGWAGLAILGCIASLAVVIVNWRGLFVVK